MFKTVQLFTNSILGIKISILFHIIEIWPKLKYRIIILPNILFFNSYLMHLL